MIRPFVYDGDDRWEYDVDEEADHPFLEVRHPEYGNDGTQLGRSPAEAVARQLASEIKAKYEAHGRKVERGPTP